MWSEEPRLDALYLPVLLKPAVVLQGFVEDLDSLLLAASDNLTSTDEQRLVGHTVPL